MVAFTTASSEAAYPKLMERLDRFGVNERVTALALPLGYSFNLDGSMVYQAFAALFIAQAYGIEMSFGQQLTLLLVMMLSSKGVAGVPRASLVVVAAVLPTFGLPEAGLLLIMGIDQFLDMGRTATNVIGNAHRDGRRREVGRAPLGPTAARRASDETPEPRLRLRPRHEAAHPRTACVALLALGVRRRRQRRQRAADWADALCRPAAAHQGNAGGTGRLPGERDPVLLPRSARAKPIGYTLDLCAAVVATIADDLGGAPLRHRIRAGHGSRTASTQVVDGRGRPRMRRHARTPPSAARQVAFSPRDLRHRHAARWFRGDSAHSRRRCAARPAGRRRRGTTNEAAMREFDRLNALASHARSRRRLSRGACDRSPRARRMRSPPMTALLRGLLVETGRHDRVPLSSATCCPSSLTASCSRATMPGIADAVERTLRGLAESREIALDLQPLVRAAAARHAARSTCR